MTLRMGLVGRGIEHSRMPRLQHYLGSLVGLNIDYVLIDGDGRDDFDPVEQVDRAIAEGFHGLNVTHPYKQRVLARVGEPLVKGHEIIGSYNTLKFESGIVRGANTDYSGFMRGYRYRLGDYNPGRVVLSGAGGVGRAIAFGLGALGCRHLDIYDVVVSQAAALEEALSAIGISARAITQNELEDCVRQADGLVNCTALGMHCHPGSALPLALIDGQKWAFDAVYTPLETPFISHCRDAGLQCLSGFDLWIFQGVDAFRHFTGEEVAVDDQLISKALGWLD